MRVLVFAVVVCFLATPAFAVAPLCVPTCDVPSAQPGYAQPVTVVLSGATVRWSGLAIEGTAHTATESGVSTGMACLNVQYVPGVGAATFTLHDGALYVQQPLKAEKRCGSAQAQPDGSFVLAYHCLYHANMVGFIVVHPA